MPKDAFYFPHDSNAKDDPKSVMLIEQLGPEGYGIYWIIIETLRDQPGYKYPLILLPALARRYNTTFEKVKAVVNSFHLFQIDGEMFFSASLLQRMATVEHKREVAIMAGKISAERRLLNSGSTGVQRQFNGRSTTVQPKKGKESKEKKSIYGELQNVFLTEEEYQKLKEKFNGQSEILINNLSTYIASRGDKYKSHYATILSWVKNETNNIPTENKDDDNW